jgi:hypothetical protein
MADLASEQELITPSFHRLQLDLTQLLAAVDGTAELDEDEDEDEDEPLPFQTSSPIGVPRISSSIESALSTQRLRPLKSFMESS